MHTDIIFRDALFFYSSSSCVKWKIHTWKRNVKWKKLWHISRNRKQEFKFGRTKCARAIVGRWFPFLLIFHEYFYTLMGARNDPFLYFLEGVNSPYGATITVQHDVWSTAFGPPSCALSDVYCMSLYCDHNKTFKNVIAKFWRPVLLSETMILVKN